MTGDRPLFDAILSVSGNDDTGETFVSVKIVDRYEGRDGRLIAEPKAYPNLDSALEFVRGAINAFAEGSGE